MAFVVAGQAPAGGQPSEGAFDGPAASKALLLEAKDNLQRMLVSIPLTDDERAAVDDGQIALDQLLARLAGIPTPSGVVSRQPGSPATPALLPIVDVRQGTDSLRT